MLRENGFGNMTGGRREQKHARSWLWKISGKAKAGVAVLIILRSVSSAAVVYFALVLRRVIDNAADGDMSAFISSAVLLGGIIVFRLVLNAFIRRMDEVMRAEIENRLKKSVYNTLLTRVYSSLSSFHTGELLNRMTNDTVVVADGMVTILPNIIAMLVKICGAAGVLMALDWRFALIFLVGGAFLLVVTYSFRRIMKRMHKQVQEADGRVRSFLQETVENLLVLRSFGAEEKVGNIASERMAEHKSVRLKRNRFSNLCNTGFAAVMDGGYVFGLIWCCFGIINGTITYGTLTAVLQLVGQIQSPFANMTGYIPKYYSMLASAERLIELEDLPAEETGRKLSAQERDSLYENMEGIDINNVSFAYPGTTQNPQVLKNAEVFIKKGSFTAVTGRSGTGKSTLLKLLLSVYTPDEGTITFSLKNGKPAAVSPALRAVFAYVPQGNFLLSGSIKEAVSFLQDEKPDMERIKESCRIACADFAEDLPEGYDTVIGEKGAGLSEGQIQRLAIARAIYSDAPVLLLDESTSALDADTEEQLLRNIRALTDKTVLIVTHRKAALDVCDNVLSVKDGMISVKEDKSEKG